MIRNYNSSLIRQHTVKQFFCSIYTGCPRRNGQNFGRVFLMLKYTDITQNTYIQSWTVTEIMAREVWNFFTAVTHLLITKFILKLAGICGSVMLIYVLNIKLTCEWHKAIKLNYKNTRTHVIVVLRVTKHFTCAVAARNALEPAARQGRTMRSVWVLRHANQVQYVEPQKAHTFLWPLSP